MSIKPITFQRNNEGKAQIADIDIAALATDYGTPVYILDQATLEQNCAVYLDNLKEYYPNSKVLYAGKANLSIGIAQFMQQQGMCLDVSSGGELIYCITSWF